MKLKLFALVLAVGALACQSTPAPAPTTLPLDNMVQTAAADIAIKTAQAAPLDSKAEMKIRIEALLGTGNRNLPRLIALNFNDPEPGAIFVNWNINDNLSEDLIRSGAKSDATDILQAIWAQTGIEYTYILLSGSFPMQDEFGNSDEKNVVNLVFNKETVEKINWTNFLSDNIYIIADEANVWAAFQDE